MFHNTAVLPVFLCLGIWVIKWFLQTISIYVKEHGFCSTGMLFSAFASGYGWA